MADCCCTPPSLNLDPHRDNATAYRRVLWGVLAINAVMFLVEIGAGLAAGSASLQADALDFLGDAANYGISLLWLGWRCAIGPRQPGQRRDDGRVRTLGYRNGGMARLARHAAQRLHDGCGRLAALAANAASFGLLWAYRGGDANMRSAWICTRNDVLGNLAVLLAALGVFGTGTGWPDVIVAAIMAALASRRYHRCQAIAGELRQPVAVPAE